MPEGRESPPPERQTDAQLNNPSEGFGTTKVGNKGEEVKSELKNLKSNPKGPLDDHLEEKFSKEKGNPVGAHVQK